MLEPKTAWALEERRRIAAERWFMAIVSRLCCNYCFFVVFLFFVVLFYDLFPEIISQPLSAILPYNIKTMRPLSCTIKIFTLFWHLAWKLQDKTNTQRYGAGPFRGGRGGRAGWLRGGARAPPRIGWNAALPRRGPSHPEGPLVAGPLRAEPARPPGAGGGNPPSSHLVRELRGARMLVFVVFRVELSSRSFAWARFRFQILSFPRSRAVLVLLRARPRFLLWARPRPRAASSSSRSPRRRRRAESERRWTPQTSGRGGQTKNRRKMCLVTFGWWIPPKTRVAGSPVERGQRIPPRMKS